MVASTNPDNLVRPEDACPNCGERDADRLVWLEPPNDDRVRCAACGTEYEPGTATRRAREGGDDARP